MHAISERLRCREFSEIHTQICCIILDEEWLHTHYYEAPTTPTLAAPHFFKYSLKITHIDANFALQQHRERHRKCAEVLRGAKSRPA